jgi:putative transposase
VAAARYIELNPVVAGLAATPWEYEWSSAAFHAGKRKSDELVVDRTLSGSIRTPREWRELLAARIDALESERLEQSLSTGRPVGSERFVARIEKRLDRDFSVRKGGWPKGRKRG